MDETPINTDIEIKDAVVPSYSKDRLSSLEKRPKNDLYTSVCHLCFPLVNDEALAEKLAA